MKKLLMLLCFGFLLLFQGGEIPITRAETLDQMLYQATKNIKGQHIPKDLLRYQQGKAEGASETADIYNRRTQRELSFIGLFQKIIDYLALVIASVAILVIVINGVRIIYSAGGEELSKAKTAIMWAAAGLGMISFSYIITKTVISLTYIN